MTDMSAATEIRTMAMHGHSPGVVLRSIVIGLTAFLTVVDLFATQAILPSLARHYQRHAGRNGLCGQRQHHGHGGRRARGRLLQPAYRSPARHSRQPCRAGDPDQRCSRSRPNLTVFTVLRVAQGLCMASAFTLTLAYLGEQCSAMDAGGAFAAYITGNVASNLIGRLISAAVADNSGPGGELLLLRAAQPRRRGARLFHHQARPARCMRWADAGLTARGDAGAFAQLRSCAPPSASASASCSPSSALSPTSTSCWCARRCRSA